MYWEAELIENLLEGESITKLLKGIIADLKRMNW